MPPEFPQMAQTHYLKELRAIYKIGFSGIKDWYEQAGIAPKGAPSRSRRRFPDDVAAICAGRCLHEIADALGWPTTTLSDRLRREHPDLYLAAWKEGQRRSAEGGRKGAAKTRAKWEAERLTKPAKPSTARRPYVLPRMKVDRVADRQETLADQARAYLQRFGPCFSARYSATPWAGGYFFKGVHYSPVRLIEEAKARGFDPDAWRQVAA